MAQVYLRKIDPTKATRTWENVFDTKIASVKGPTQKRWERHKKSKVFDSIRNKVLTQTLQDDLREILYAKNAKISTIKSLTELHKFAVDNGYLLGYLLPKTQWPEIEHGETRAIKLDEHLKIIEREPNEERKAYYKMLWLVGGSQSDIAELNAENVNWKDETLSYYRKKCGSLATLKMGTALKALIKSLPQSGNLFPYLCTVRESDRATEFKQRCKSVGIVDKTLKLHSYRYAIIEHMREEG